MFVKDIKVGAELVVPVSPFADESLADLILRASAENSYPEVQKVLKLAGLTHRNLCDLCVTGFPSSDILAKVLGVPGGRDQLERGMYRAVDEKRGWVSFFGSYVRWTHINRSYRRVSPRSLRSRPYYKAAWSVKVLSFDPSTKEVLLAACPQCGRGFDYLRTRGTTNCAFCISTDRNGFTRSAVDLRDFPQALVEVGDLEALDFLTSLVDPEYGTASRTARKLADIFVELNRGEVFEFAIALACAMTADPKHSTTTLNRPHDNDDYRRFTPEVLARAGRVILDWPEGLHSEAELVRAAADERPGHFGIKKELGPLLAITVDPHIYKSIKEALHQVLKDNMAASAGGVLTIRRVENRFRPDLITTTAAATKYGCSRRTLAKLASRSDVTSYRSEKSARSPVLFSEGELEKIMAMRTRLIPSQEFAVALGVPRLALRDIAARSLIRHETGPVTELLLGKDYYDRESTDRLRRQLLAKAQEGEPPLASIRITVAVNRLSMPLRYPWADVCTGILENRISVWKFSGRVSAVMTSLAVSDISVLRELLEAQNVAPANGKNVALTQVEASVLLSTTPHNVNGLIQAGLLPSRITALDIDEFRGSFMLTTDVLSELQARGLSMSRQTFLIRAELAGVKPITRLKHGHKSVWSRNNITSFLKNLTLR